ncbi:TetR/AcrR family transcriptional regulator [Amycolatopsis pithecellobii]|uniref:TetR family transcriptional regulator n=1 Tax=Amycolatopsis pithecellobii TaxID=664692 RepID=A0A6N7Z5M3_9PSEU|nr:TetR/AcrR family transcriptional regulator [Amycolatopsis pithecellobii]MTD56011.1 TetR family transcriptional regulator [Amycolatopsis pithecellobii]
MDHAEATTRALDAAEELFYERGVQAVGMDAVRAACGVSLKRLYQCFPSKDELVAAYLRRRDQRWRANLASVVEQRTEPADRLAGVFDWLYDWFSEPGFRGCAFINSFGELGTTSPAVAVIAREHKEELKRYVARLVRRLPVDHPARVTEQLFLLIEGAIVTAAITGNPDSARHARAAAEAILAAHYSNGRPT